MSTSGTDASGVTVRPAGRADVPLLTDVIRQAYQVVADRFHLTRDNCPKHPSNCTRDWIAADMDRGVMYYVAVTGADHVLGCAAIEQASAHECYLERLAVWPRHQRQGIGRLLAAHVVAEAGRRGARLVGIGIIDAQHELKAWYEKMGFAETHTRDFPHLPFTVAFMTRSEIP